jgi:hypothetical protein
LKQERPADWATPEKTFFRKTGRRGHDARGHERLGVTENSNSPLSLIVVLVRKKNGHLCFCLDYRKLNDVARKDSFPLLLINDTLDTLEGTNVSPAWI